MIKLGKGMSPKLDDYIKKGLEARAKQVRLDEIFQPVKSDFSAIVSRAL